MEYRKKLIKEQDQTYTHTYTYKPILIHNYLKHTHTQSNKLI